MTHTPRLMMLQLDSQIREVGPNYLEPVLREGNADGSLHVEHVREASDLLLLITNQYLNPLLYPMTPEEARERCSFVRQLLAGVGLDVFDGEMLENFCLQRTRGQKAAGKRSSWAKAPGDVDDGGANAKRRADVC